jgi:hypothetical protein
MADINTDSLIAGMSSHLTSHELTAHSIMREHCVFAEEWMQMGKSRAAVGRPPLPPK